MNQNLSQFTKPLKVNNNDEVYCPYIKIDNNYKNTPIPQPKTLIGAPVEKICVPNFSSRNPDKSFGKNICKQNLPYHLSFFEKEKSDCYRDNNCTQYLDTCLDPLVEQ